MNSSVTGLFCLVALFVSDAFLGTCGLLGAVTATLVANVLGLDRDVTRSGLLSYNGCLVAVAIGLFLGGSGGSDNGVGNRHSRTVTSALHALVPAIGMAAASPLVTSAIGRVTIIHFGLAPLTFPGEIVTWCFILAASQGGHVQDAAGVSFAMRGGGPVYDVAATTTAATTVAGANLTSTSVADAAAATSATTTLNYTGTGFLAGTAAGVGQVMLASSPWSGGIMIIGIAFCSPIAALLAVLGSAVGAATAMGLGVDAAAVHAGIHGCNPALTALALGGYFFAPYGKKVFVLAFAACALSAVASAAAAEAFEVGLPVLTFPFTVVTWIFCLLSGSIPGVIPVAIVALSTPEEHRRRILILKTMKVGEGRSNVVNARQWWRAASSNRNKNGR
jgi:urea transporter